MWALYAFGAAFMHATMFALTKKYLKDVPRFLFLSLSWIGGAILLLAVNLIVGFPEIGLGFWSALAVTAILNTIACFLYTKALMTTDISLAFPMIAFTPAFLLLTSPLIRGEYPSMLGAAGILLLVLGAYLLGFDRPKDALEPFRNLFRSPGVMLMLLVALLWSVSSNFDKTTATTSNPLFPPMLSFTFMGLFFLGWSAFRGERIRKGAAGSPSPIALAKTAAVGLVPAASAFLQNTAFLGAIVPYVMAIKRTSLLFNLAYARILFKEKALLRRGFAALIMCAGAAVILLAA